MTTTTALPAEAYAAALAALPEIGPARLRALLDGVEPEACWRALCDRGPVPALGAGAELVRWRHAATAFDLAGWWRRVVEAGIGIVRHGGPGYPAALLDDPEPPAVLFVRGDGAAVDAGPRVAVVGTRRCTHSGRDIARQLGHELAASGVVVVSGLALGIDGAAHRGAIAAGGAPPVAVVGSGPDVVYPRSHRDLWEAVVGAGCLLAEAPPGAAPLPWRFPLRNRIIAGLADVLVVVESARAGGSMHTVEAAIERGVPVLAVPGSVRSPASAGTNQLLAAGCAPVCDSDDVLVALDLERIGQAAAATRRPQPARTPPSAADAVVLDAVGWEATSVDTVVRRSGLRPASVLAALERLASSGWIAGSGAAWERR